MHARDATAFIYMPRTGRGGGFAAVYNIGKELPLGSSFTGAVAVTDADVASSSPCCWMAHNCRSKTSHSSRLLDQTAYVAEQRAKTTILLGKGFVEANGEVAAKQEWKRSLSYLVLRESSAAWSYRARGQTEHTQTLIHSLLVQIHAAI